MTADRELIRFSPSPQITVPEGSSELTVAADGRVSVKLQGERHDD